MRDYLATAQAEVRRKDREVTDEAWIREMLRTAPYGVLATAHEGQPFVNSNLFAYDEGEHAIYTHTSHAGRTSSNTSAADRVCFTVFEMGRLLPAPRAFNMSVEYEGVVVFGRARVLEGEEEKRRGLQRLLDKYFGHLLVGADYAPPSEEELKLTSVYRIAIDSWSGKRKAVDAGYEGAFQYGEKMDDGRWRREARGSVTTSAEQRIAGLGLELPGWRAPAGTFVHAVRSGDLLYTSGHAPIRADGSVVLGRLGADLDVDTGYEAARAAALNMLATMRHELGSLDRVARIVRVLGTVNATPEFIQHTQVINGASAVLVQVFGEAGKHARLAVGVSSLPFNIALEVEAIVEVRDWGLGTRGAAAGDVAIIRRCTAGDPAAAGETGCATSRGCRR